MKEIGVIYICIHQRLVNSVNGNEPIIKRTKLLETLGRLYHIPKEDRQKIVEEMEDLGLIEVLDRFKVKVNRDLK